MKKLLIELPFDAVEWSWWGELGFKSMWDATRSGYKSEDSRCGAKHMAGFMCERKPLHKGDHIEFLWDFIDSVNKRFTNEEIA